MTRRRVSFMTSPPRSPEPTIKIFTFRPPKKSNFSAIKFICRIKTEFTRALGIVSSSRKMPPSISSSPSSSSSSSSSNCTLRRSVSYAEPFDSHRAQAVQDCIQFLNSSSSSSFQRYLKMDDFLNLFSDAFAFTGST
ncbi:hypothetical protein HanRHA438_Chr10g0441891 [Helianthus annuus]|nr:hypothetical protein HanRHA438_Chr10g0441891 [Helianthus annuus]